MGLSEHTERPSATDLALAARTVRADVISALWDCGGGHYGGSLSVVDILIVLYERILRVVPARAADPNRDRLVFSKGHAAIALYAVLRRQGFFVDELGRYATSGSRLQGHPDLMLPGIDFSTGSLGQGLSAGLGMAIALRPPRRTWVILGDGECQEGKVWEAAMLAARLRVENLHAIVDANGHQEWGWDVAPGEQADPVPALAMKFRAFGWRVLEVAGHDVQALERAARDLTTTRGRPSLIVAHTVKGRGVPMFEADPRRYHCATLTREEHERALRGFRT